MSTMRIPIKFYYYNFYDMGEATPFSKMSIKTFLAFILGIEGDTPDFTSYQVPSDLTTNEVVYNEFLSLIYGRYYKQYLFKIAKKPFEPDPNDEEIEEHFKEWGFRFISLLNLTYEYYVPILKFYRDEKANLMDNVVATSENAIGFNDTPQNANTAGVYEGDDYISQFTKTRGTSSSPLTTVINRLKEIQEGYKNVMADWVKDFEKLFLEVQGYEEQ